MNSDVIYLDHQASTPVATEVIDVMLPMFSEQYANSGSVTHLPGRDVAEQVERASARIADSIGASASEIVFTSGATESNNLALLGVCLHPRQKRRRIISVETEHRALLDPLKKLAKQGFDVQIVSVLQAGAEQAGVVDMEQLERLIDDDTALVSVMLANNEIGVIQPLKQIAELCRRRGALLHTDGAQAVGRVPVDVGALDVDLLSFSAHKCYGPKGVGGLYVRSQGRRVRLAAQIVGGGQQDNLRSGTLNTPGVIGMAAAIQLCDKENDWHETRSAEPLWKKLARQSTSLWEHLTSQIPDLEINGPSVRELSLDELAKPGTRLPGNLNCSFMPVEGQSLMLATPRIAVSSGSACTSAEPDVSHVLKAIGLSDDYARSSLRFGIGRGTTDSQLKDAAELLADSARRLRQLV
ncbi:MAG: IscS subfamily cysteine desulfurase [Aureliella sp.]